MEVNWFCAAGGNVLALCEVISTTEAKTAFESCMVFFP
jgi:hypothetical protein